MTTQDHCIGHSKAVVWQADWWRQTGDAWIWWYWYPDKTRTSRCSTDSDGQHCCCHLANNFGSRLPILQVQGPMAIALPSSRFPVPSFGRFATFGRATAGYVDRPQAAMGSPHWPGQEWRRGPAGDQNGTHLGKIESLDRDPGIATLDQGMRFTGINIPAFCYEGGHRGHVFITWGLNPFTKTKTSPKEVKTPTYAHNVTCVKLHTHARARAHTHTHTPV